MQQVRFVEMRDLLLTKLVYFHSRLTNGMRSRTNFYLHIGILNLLIQNKRSSTVGMIIYDTYMRLSVKELLGI